MLRLFDRFAPRKMSWLRKHFIASSDRRRANFSFDQVKKLCLKCFDCSVLVMAELRHQNSMATLLDLFAFDLRQHLRIRKAWIVILRR